MFINYAFHKTTRAVRDVRAQNAPAQNVTSAAGANRKSARAFFGSDPRHLGTSRGMKLRPTHEDNVERSNTRLKCCSTMFMHNVARALELRASMFMRHLN